MFLPRAAFILLSLCSIMTFCTESPITTKSPSDPRSVKFID